jgi:hypothetical protein
VTHLATTDAKSVLCEGGRATVLALTHENLLDEICLTVRGASLSDASRALGGIMPDASSWTPISTKMGEVMTKAITCQIGVPEARLITKACTPSADRITRMMCKMGRFVRSLPNPSRSTKGSEKAVAMAYCQKVSDCGLKPNWAVITKVMALAAAKQMPASTIKAAPFRRLV